MMTFQGVRQAWPPLRFGVCVVAGLLLGAATPLSVRALEPLSDRASTRQGFLVGIHAVGDRIGAEDPGPGGSAGRLFVDEGGAGLGLRCGYTFTPSFGLVLSLVAANHATSVDQVDVTHSSFTIEAHYRFLPGEVVRPYLCGGIGGAVLRFDAGRLRSQANGGVAVLGAGLLFDVHRHLSLDLAGRLDLINWDRISASWDLDDGGRVEVKGAVDESGTAAKVLLGMNYHF